MKIIPLVILFFAGLVHAAPASQPTPAALARAASIKANISSFSLDLSYHGEQDKPFYGLHLSVPKITSDNAFEPAVTITPQQAEKIIDHLTEDGFLDRAIDAENKKIPAPAMPCYTMSVTYKDQTGSHQLYDTLGWNLPLLKRLDGLRTVLEDDAGKSTDRLLNRMSGLREQWSHEAANAAIISEPVRENGADFQILVQPQWSIPPAGGKAEIELALRITNHTDKAMQLNLFDTATIVLKDSTGNTLRHQYGRNRSHVPDPLLVKAGEDKSISRHGTLEWAEDRKSLRLIGHDEAGGIWWFDGLTAGKYTISITFENNQDSLKFVKPAVDAKDAPFWMGKAATKELTVEIADQKVGAR